MSKKLLPCPFCGGEARLTAAMGETWMRCIDCNAGSEMSGSRALAIAAWNRRTPPAMSADHIGEASNMVAPVAALSSKPVDDTGEANSSVKFHVEAVAWRYRYPNDPTWQLTLDCKQAHDKTGEVQPLFTHPAPIKPSGDTGELRERVAKIVDPAGFDDRWDVPGLRHEASLDERVDEALAKADAILDLIQSERGKAVPMTAQDLADHAADAFDNALPDDALPHEVGRAWKAVGERLAAILAERAEE